MPAILENSAVAAGLENVSFHSNPKEGQNQRMFKLWNDFQVSFHPFRNACPQEEIFFMCQER